MKKMTIASVLVGVGLMIAPPAFAQSSTLTLSLDEAIARGRTAAPRIADAKARREAADATVTSREALRDRKSVV